MEQKLPENTIAKKQEKIEITPYQMSYFSSMESNSDKQKKMEDFKHRLNEFNNITTLEEAKNLLNTIMPVSMERTVFFIDDAKCTIINKEHLLKIIYKSKTDYILFNFI